MSRGYQSKGMSFIEALSNVIVGYVVALLLNYWVLREWGYEVTWRHSSDIAVVFTVVSIIRSFILRRIWNRVRNWI